MISSTAFLSLGRTLPRVASMTSGLDPVETLDPVGRFDKGGEKSPSPQIINLELALKAVDGDPALLMPRPSGRTEVVPNVWAKYPGVSVNRKTPREETE